MSSCVVSYKNRAACPLTNSFLPKSGHQIVKEGLKSGRFSQWAFYIQTASISRGFSRQNQVVKVIRLRAFYCRSLVPWESGWQILSRQKRDDLELSNSRTASNGLINSLYSYYIYTLKRILVVPVQFDEELWEYMVGKLRKFFFQLWTQWCLNSSEERFLKRLLKIKGWVRSHF